MLLSCPRSIRPDLRCRCSDAQTAFHVGTADYKPCRYPAFHQSGRTSVQFQPRADFDSGFACDIGNILYRTLHGKLAAGDSALWSEKVLLQRKLQSDLAASFARRSGRAALRQQQADSVANPAFNIERSSMQQQPANIDRSERRKFGEYRLSPQRYGDNRRCYGFGRIPDRNLGSDSLFIHPAEHLRRYSRPERNLCLPRRNSGLRGSDSSLGYGKQCR